MNGCVKKATVSVLLVLMLSGMSYIKCKTGNGVITKISTKACPGQKEQYAENEPCARPKLVCRYTPIDVPDVDSSFKTWMSYKAVTDKKSPQYNLINTYGWSDSQGFMRCSGERDLGIDQDYYLIALGSYYGTEIGTKYKITLDTGRVFYGALADCKDNRHTNSTNQYVSHNGNVVEFLVDSSKLNKEVKRMGSANVYMPLNGSVVKIERIDFVFGG